MKGLFGVFKRMASLLGMLALSALIWYVGPLFAFSDWRPLEPERSRWIAIGLLALLWGGRLVWRWWTEKRANLQMLMGMMSAPAAAQSPEARESAEEVAVLRRRFEEALSFLKKARLGGKRFGRRYVYQLPWYVIIGPPGSGKTTALLHSDLHFPLAERLGRDEIQGVGGTRNCDWWFTDEAVLLDTAGRYSTQDSHQAVDRSAWLGFLGLLKKYRRRRPINGVLIAVSVADLLQQGEAERAGQARAIRARVQELYEQLGIRLPLYMMFTKADLLAGFMEFFGDLGKEDRAQVWGMTFPVEAHDAGGGAMACVAPELSGLEERLYGRLLARMQQERDLERRALIYTFPQQFRLLMGLAQSFLNDVFQPSRFEERPWLRGVYFISGTQEGTPIDRIMSALSASFGMDRRALAPHGGTGKSYFITRLLGDVVFQEAGLAGTNLKLERQRAWLERGGYAAVLGVTALVATGWFTSYTRNTAYVEEVAGQVRGIEPQMQSLAGSQGDVLQILPLLNAARNIPGGYRDRAAGTPWGMGFGLYQGDKLGAEAGGLYQRLLREAFLPRLLMRIEEQLRPARNADPDFLYEGLKVYLMLGEAKQFDADAIKAWITLGWERDLPREVTTEQRQQLGAHLNALFERGPVELPLPLDSGLIRAARKSLARMPLAERVYRRFKHFHRDLALPDFRISEAAGRDAPVVFVRKSNAPLSQGLPGLYTYAAYHEVFQKESPLLAARLAEEGWIYEEQSPVTDPAALARLAEEVRRLYLQDYVRQWDALLADLDIAPFTSPDQAVRILGVLSGEESPLRKLLESVDRETWLERSAEQDPGLIDKAGKKVDDAKEKLQRLFGGAEAATTAPPPPENPARIVTEHFAEIHKLVHGEAGAPPPLDKTLAGLTELYTYLNAVASAIKRGESPAAVPGGEVLSRLNLVARAQPAPVGALLRAVVGKSSSITKGSERERLNSLWGSTVVPFCRKGINGRYPLVRNSRQEVTQEDFGRFFGPGGLMDDFFLKNLKPFVDTSGGHWRWASADNVSLGMSAGVLTEFQRAAYIKDMFFRGGGPMASVRFELKPLTMDADIDRFLLDLDGQVVTYSHDPARPAPLQWPGPQSTRQVRIQISPPAPSGRSGLTEDGPWAWFRFLDKAARIETTAQPERFTITFNIDGRKAAFELWASSVLNPFGAEAFENFHCPERL